MTRVIGAGVDATYQIFTVTLHTNTPYSVPSLPMSYAMFEPSIRMFCITIGLLLAVASDPAELYRSTRTWSAMLVACDRLELTQSTVRVASRTVSLVPLIVGLSAVSL